jgi:hypothetical protein
MKPPCPSLRGKGARGLGFSATYADAIAFIEPKKFSQLFFIILSPQVRAVLVALTDVAFQAQCLKVFHIISATD